MASLNIHLRRFLDWFLALFAKGHLVDDTPQLPEAIVVKAPLEPKPLPPAPDDHVDADAITPPVADLPLVLQPPTPIAPLANLLPPLLIVDLYWQDQKKPAWPALLANPQISVVGAIIKATQGVSYYTDAIEWFKKQWALLAELDLRRGAYHYLNFNQSGVAQAEYHAKTVGLDSWKRPRTILPIVDVERGKEGGANYKASAAQIVDVTSDYIARMRSLTGLDSILYGRGAMRDLGITSKMGAKWLWNPSYTAVMKASTITRIGWSVSEVCMWQYTDGDYCTAKTTTGKPLPKTIPGFGSEDTSVYLGGKTVADFDRQLCAI